MRAIVSISILPLSTVIDIGGCVEELYSFWLFVFFGLCWLGFRYCFYIHIETSVKMLFLSTLNRGIFPKVRVVSFEKLFEKPFLQQQKENVN